MNARLLFVHALSPLHAGTGQGVAVIDLPIAREKATNLPYLPGSSLKGTLRDTPSAHVTDDLRAQIFGPDGVTVTGDKYAGSVQFSDQRLLLLPVRSLIGTFAWVTSPYVLQRLLRDAKGAELTGLPESVPKPARIESCIVARSEGIVGDGKTVYLEDLDLPVEPNPDEQELASSWATWIGQQLFPGDGPDETAWRDMLAARLCIVHDDALSFLLETATEITARIKLLEDTKTVKDGALWYEEALPTETILYGLVVATPVRKFNLDQATIFDALASLMTGSAQFGGKATVGRGLCRIQMQALGQ
jgi:CRISPR-associated protein Cmr4